MVLREIKSNLGSDYNWFIRLLDVRCYLNCRSSLQFLLIVYMCKTAGFKLVLCPWPAKTLIPEVTVNLQAQVS